MASVWVSLRRAVLVALPAAMVLLIVPELAAACSCAPRSEENLFKGSDAAVVARLVEVTEDPPADGAGPFPPAEADFRYRVRRVFRGERRFERGDSLVIRSSTSEASCGLPSREGKRYGLLLQRRKGEWKANLCSVVSRRKMRRAARTGGAYRLSGGCSSR